MPNHRSVCRCGAITISKTRSPGACPWGPHWTYDERLDEPAAERERPQPEYEYLLELVCLHCGRRIGDAVVAKPSAPILLPRTVRCRHCGGPPVPSGHQSQRPTKKVTPFGPDEQPRRGRPPTWLVEQRLAGLASPALMHATTRSA